MHKLGHFVAGEKVGHFVRWDNLSPEKCKLNNGFLIYMPEIWPKIAQDISQICPRYAQALPEVWGFKLRKWDKMSPGRVHKLGHYVAGEVHNAVGHFVVGTFCLLTFLTMCGHNVDRKQDQLRMNIAADINNHLWSIDLFRSMII